MTEILLLARSGSQLSTIRRVLESLGVRVVAIDDAFGGSLTESLRGAIDRADLAVVVWDTKQLPPAVMFEAGYALARGVHVVVLDARKGKSALTDDAAVETLLPGIRLHSALHDFDQLREEFEALLNVIHDPAPNATSPRKPRYGRLTASSSNQLGQRAIQALERAGAVVIESEASNADFFIAFEELESQFNPIPVEVSRGTAGSHARRYLGALESGRWPIAVAISAEGGQDALGPVPGGTGLVLVEHRLETIEDDPSVLLTSLRRARNYLVHRRAW